MKQSLIPSINKKVSSYPIVRDSDAGIKSLSTVEGDFIRQGALRSCNERRRVLRVDGRSAVQTRPSQLLLQRSDQSSSATVHWGTATRVICSCTGQIIPPPNMDRPNEGVVQISVDLSPSASTCFRHAAPATNGGSTAPSSSSWRGTGAMEEGQKLETNRILRCLERILLTGSSCLDTEALVITPGAWVWKIALHLTVLDAGGNLLDASVLACIASLRHYRKPHVHVVESMSTSHEGETTNNNASTKAPVIIPSDQKEAIPLPLHHTPLSISFALIPSTTTIGKVAILMDPTDREELVAAGTLTYAMNVHREICFMDFSGGCEVALSLLRDCHELAAQKITDLCQSLETSLEQADEKALQERLTRLQQQQGMLSSLPSPSRMTEEDQRRGVPFYQSEDAMDVDDDEIEEKAREAAGQAEEEYRQRALDYNLGHVATKVREIEDEPTTKSHSRPAAHSLLSAIFGSMEKQHESSKPPIQPDVVSETTKVTASVQSANTAEEEHLPIDTKSVATPTGMVSPTLQAVLDSDEEETTMEVHSEFQESMPAAAPSHSQHDDEDVDDLAAAIKTKKSKSKKKKK